MNASIISIERSIDKALKLSADEIISEKLEELNKYSRFCYTSSEIAKKYSMNGADLNSFLKDRGIIRKINRQWCLTRRYQNKHLTEYRYSLKYGQNGKRRLRATLVWTDEGKDFLNQLIY